MTEQPSPEQAVDLPPCDRCGHSPDAHSHDDVNDNHKATDPDCPFRCNECDCPDYENWTVG